MRTLRQILPGDEIVQLVIRLGLLAILIVWTLVLIRPFVPPNVALDGRAATAAAAATSASNANRVRVCISLSPF